MGNLLLKNGSTVLVCTAMDLQTYISDMPRRAALARETGRSPAYLYQIATGRRRASTSVAQDIERATEKLGPETVTRASLRPDVWADAA